MKQTIAEIKDQVNVSMRNLLKESTEHKNYAWYSGVLGSLLVSVAADLPAHSREMLVRTMDELANELSNESDTTTVE